MIQILVLPLKRMKVKNSKNFSLKTSFHDPYLLFREAVQFVNEGSYLCAPSGGRGI
jgi:hypothetical protein